MPRQRRTPSKRPANRRGADRRPRTAAKPAAAPAARSRFTGRAAILVLIVLVLVISYASSLHAWLQQREDLAQARTQISESSQNIDDLKREKRRWKDPAYVERQARDRFGWVLPGEVGYRVIGEDGKPLDGSQGLENGPVGAEDETQWYDRLWDSVETAGEKPKKREPKGVGSGDVIKPRKRDDVHQKGESGQ